MICKHRIEKQGTPWGLCRIGEAEIGTHEYSKCHEVLCGRCVAAGEATQSAGCPNEYLASVLRAAAETAKRQPDMHARREQIEAWSERWKNSLRVITPEEQASAIEKTRTPELGADGKKAKRGRCIHIGLSLDRTPGRICFANCVHECTRFTDGDGLKLHVIPAKQCATCNGYEPNDTKED